RACPVVPLVRRGSDLKIMNIFNPTEASQAVTNDFDFCGELCFVSKLLKIAAAAAAKIGTGRLDALRRGRNYFFDSSENNVALCSINSYAQTVPGSGKRHHYGFAFRMRKALFAGKDLLSRYLEFISPCVLF